MSFRLVSGLWLLLSGTVLVAQTLPFRVTPPRIRQGEVMRVSGPAQTLQARLRDVTIHLFAQSDGTMFGLLPVRALAEPGVDHVEFLDASGNVLQQESVTIVDARYPRQNVRLTAAIAALQSSTEERERQSAFLHEVLPERYWQEPFRVPVPGCLTSLYGVARAHNGTLTGDYHKGVDQGSGMGTPIHATAAGVVKIVQQFPLSGGTVAVDHGQGLQSMYLHMSRFAVAEGAQVQAGDVLGYVGATGRVTGPHLQWGLYANGVPVNPAQWMRFPACAPKPAGARTATRKK